MGAPQLKQDYSQAVSRIASVLVACVVGLSLVSTAGAVERFERHAVPGQRMSLSVPASWITVDASLPPSAIARLARENPRLAPYLAQLSGPTSAAKLLALDPAVRNGFSANVNVIAAPIPPVTFTQYRSAIVREIQSLLGSAAIDHREVRIDGVRGVRLSYPFQITIGRPYTVSTLQYAFPRRGTSVVVTYTTLPRHKARYAPTFARSAASIRFR